MPEDERRICSHKGCSDFADKRWTATTYYCNKHASIRAMRSNARNSDKYVPEFKDIEAAWPDDDNCPRCERSFVFGRVVQNDASPSLQHFAATIDVPNPIGVVCHRCNNNLRNLGDGIEAMQIPLNLRKCTRCNELKDLSEFGWHTSRVTGKSNIGSHCKPCASADAAESTRRIRASKKQ